MINKIKQVIYQKYLKFSKNVRFDKNCIINRNSNFEGFNKLFSYTTVTNSYIGYGTYIASNSYISHANIGRYCAIGQNVKTYVGNHPVKDFVSIHPAFFSTKKQCGFTYVGTNLFQEHTFVDNDQKFVCKIGNDVWIGNDVIIFDGVSIGNGAIIGAGSIVTKDIEPYSIAYGVPCRVQKFRFDQEIIKELEDFSWWNKDLKWISDNAFRFNNIQNFLTFIKEL